MKKFIFLPAFVIALSLLSNCGPNDNVNINTTVLTQNKSPTVSAIPTPVPTIFPSPVASTAYNFPDIKGEFFINDKNYVRSFGSNLFLDEKGDGILIWDGLAKQIKNFLLVGNIFNIGTDQGLSAISLNEKGDGLIIWKSYPVGSTGAPPPENLYYRKIVNYRPVDQQITLSSGDFQTLFITLDETGTGNISWFNKNREIEIREVKNYLPIETGSTIYKPEAVFPPFISLDSNGTGFITWISSISGDNNFYLKKFQNYEPTGTEIKVNELKHQFLLTQPQVNKNGNGIISWTDNSGTLFLRKIVNFQPIDSEINLGFMMGNYRIIVDETGNGLLIEKDLIDKSDIYARKITNYQITSENMKITNSTAYPRSFPGIKVNSMGDGLMVWSEMVEGTLSVLKARLINKFQPQ